MIARGQDINLISKEFLDNLPGQAETRGRIFPVGNDEVYLPVPHEFRKEIVHRPASGFTYYIADK
jgi:hypothetical protein